MKTKIVATLGPASKSEQVIWGMIEAGADVFRINLSHGDREQWDSLVEVIRKVSSEMGEEVAILADLQGPKIRTGETPLGGIKLNTGDIVTLTTRQVSMESGLISINYKDFAKDVKAGERVLIDDGKLTLLIRSSDMKSEVQAEVLNGGVLTSRKGVNLPNTVLSLPALTSRDRENLEWIMKSDIDWVALSFVRSSGDIRALRDAMKMYPRGFYPGIIAKIEKPEAVADIDPIIRAADAIMIARGDLGVEIPFEQVPFIQKSIIQKCIKHGRPVIVATQMLEGMLTSMQPTRAEINDVANSVIDGADALMLSGETSAGPYPVEAVATMHKVIEQAEMFEDIYYRTGQVIGTGGDRFITDTLCSSAVNMAYETNAKSIVAYTHTGYTAIKISSHRPNARVVVFTPQPFVIRKLQLVWGVKGFIAPDIEPGTNVPESMRSLLNQQGVLQPGELVVHLSSFPMQGKGKTNMVLLAQV